MRPLIFFVIFHTALCTSAIGQEVPPVSSEAERKLISDRKREIDARYEMELVECQSKFARIDCEKRVKKERRANVESLRHREKEINDAERQAKAVKQRARAEERVKSASDRDRSPAGQSRNSRQDAQPDRDSAAVQAQIRAQARYDEKIKQAESHRQKIEDSNRSKPSKAAGLSDPSGFKSAE